MAAVGGPSKAQGSAHKAGDRSPRVTQLYPAKGHDVHTVIDIFAIHGMDTTSPKTWIFKDEEHNVNWLQDPDMLPQGLPNARILTCNWPSRLYRDPNSVEMVILELAQGLLLDIQAERGRAGLPTDRPLAFIASCLGGHVLAKALTIASQPRSDYSKLLEATAGIIFLATPFRGTSLADLYKVSIGVLQARSFFTGEPVAKKLLDNIGKSTADLEELVSKFTETWLNHGRLFPVYCFYEKQATDIAKKVLPSWLSRHLTNPKLLVESVSARLDIAKECIPFDTRHLFMNKFSGPRDVHYERVLEKLRVILDVAENINTTCTGPIDKVEVYFQISETERVSRDWVQVVEWLVPPVQVTNLQASIHGEARENHYDGTCLWFTNGTSLKEWLSRSSALRWVHGGVGCGKTVLFYLAVEKVRKFYKTNSDARFSYFYCTLRDPSGQDFRTMLQAIIVQLCPPPSIPELVKRLYDDCNRTSSPKHPTTRELISTLKDLILSLSPIANQQLGSPSNDATPGRNHHPNTIFILIDALDEIPWTNRGEVLSFLQELVDLKLSHLHILVTSREEPDIQDAISRLFSWEGISVDAGAVQPDIKRYVAETIQNYGPLRRLDVSTREAIMRRVGDQANGMFRWAFLQMQSLKRIRVLVSKTVLPKLASLPSDLNATYCSILEETEEVLVPYASKALFWVAFSKRTLYIEELVDACAIDLDRVPVLDERLTAYNIFELLRDLVLIRPAFNSEQDIALRTHTVMLSHASVSEFLYDSDAQQDALKDFFLKSLEANSIIASSCLAYLYHYNTIECPQDYPLLPYAWYNWEKHVNIVHSGYPDSDLLQNTQLNPATETFRRRAIKLYKTLHDVAPMENQSEFKTTEEISDFKAAMDEATPWLKKDRREQLREAINVPYFYPNFELFLAKNNPSPERYRHFPLQDPSNSMRLLEILPSLDYTTVVRGRLLETTLESAPPYSALSYVWGDPSDLEDVCVDGQWLRVTPNLDRILRSLRLRAEETALEVWVDALCINQYDMVEKSSQVLLIGKIFQNAKEVIVGQGPEIETDEEGIRLLEELATFSRYCREPHSSKESLAKFQSFILWVHDAGKWHYISQLFRSPWWSRMWIIQEIVLAAKAMVMIGSLSINFDIVEEAARAEQTITNILSEKGVLSTYLESVNAGWRTAREITQAIDERKQGVAATIPQQLWRFRHGRSVDPRDRIYSLLALCDQEQFPTEYIDYSQTAGALFTRTTVWIITRYQTLDFLSIRSAYEFKGQYSLQMPSWAIPFGNDLSARIPLTCGIFDRNASTHLYTASTVNMAPVLKIVDSQLLILSGHAFDKVASGVIMLPDRGFDMSKHIRDYSDDLREYLSTISQLQFLAHTTQSAVEVRWRTILADQWHPKGRLGVLGTFKFVGLPMPPTTVAEEEKILQEIIRRAAAGDFLPLTHLVGRGLVISEMGKLGLVPKETLPGDHIVIFRGGTVPYVVRATYDANYVFIGECYIHDCMDGQVLEQFEADGEECCWDEEFPLV